MLAIAESREAINANIEQKVSLCDPPYPQPQPQHQP
jgi:hypothetical protein